MNVPLLDLKAQYKPLQGEFEEVFSRIAESQMLILGKETTKLEETLAEYTGCKFALGVSSGTDALLMALMALDIKPGDEVIIPTYSFFATAGVVARLGATPVFIDSEPVTMNLNPTLLESLISERTKAIVPVHLYGQCAEMDEILAIANKHNIPVIEDCAQSLGVTYKDGQQAGSMGLMGCYSFYPTKNLGAFGDAGLITTNDEALFVKLKQMRNHGMEPRYYHKFIGGNFRIDELQSAFLNVKFPHLESWHEGRRKNAEFYSNAFVKAGVAESTGIVDFSPSNKVLLPKAVFKESGVKNYHIYNQYCIRVEKRDELRSFLNSKSVGSEIYYPVPFHRQECFSYLGAEDKKFPVANVCSNETIALPIFPELKEEQLQYVVDCIVEFVQS